MQAGRFFSSSLIMRFILEPGVLSSGSSEVYPPDRYLVQVPVLGLPPRWIFRSESSMRSTSHVGFSVQAQV